MNPLDVLLKTVEKLDLLGIPYMVTGAFAVSYYGRPRSTHDIDLVVETDLSGIQPLHQAFRDDFYASREAMEDACRHGSMFNLIHNLTAIKVDFWMLEDTPFDLERFSRRVEQEIRGMPVCLSSPEDMVIIKLDWFKKTCVSKHFEDALGIVQIQQDALDIGYTRRWCELKSTADILERLLGAAG